MAKIGTKADLARWVVFLEGQPLPLEVTSKPWKPARRLESNAFLWAFVYRPLVEVAGHEESEWHEFFCCRYFGAVPYIRIDGTEGERPVRTTTKNEDNERDVLKGDAFNKFLCYVESECASRGVFIERGAV